MKMIITAHWKKDPPISNTTTTTDLSISTNLITLTVRIPSQITNSQQTKNTPTIATSLNTTNLRPIVLNFPTSNKIISVLKTNKYYQEKCQISTNYLIQTSQWMKKEKKKVTHTHMECLTTKEFKCRLTNSKSRPIKHLCLILKS